MALSGQRAPRRSRPPVVLIMSSSNNSSAANPYEWSVLMPISGQNSGGTPAYPRRASRFLVPVDPRPSADVAPPPTSPRGRTLLRAPRARLLGTCSLLRDSAGRRVRSSLEAYGGDAAFPPTLGEAVGSFRRGPRPCAEVRPMFPPSRSVASSGPFVYLEMVGDDIGAIPRNSLMKLADNPRRGSAGRPVPPAARCLGEAWPKSRGGLNLGGGATAIVSARAAGVRRP